MLQLSGLVGACVAQHTSILLVGRPGVGKTTLLRDMARVLADEHQLAVVVVDSSLEIAGGCGSLQYIPLLCIALQYSAVQCLALLTVQYSTVQYSTVQYSTVQYSTVQFL
jgi:energy-coupling factor transporter ATP-binding protein EcfA2